jgi:hypothetical protein
MEESSNSSDRSADQESKTFKQHYAGTFVAKRQMEQYHKPRIESQQSSRDPDDPLEAMMKLWNFIKDPNHSGAVIAILTVVIALSNIGYDIVASCQLKSMNGQLVEMRQQTILNRQQLVGAQAAMLDYLTPTWETGEEEGKVSETLINRGLISAREVQFDITVIRERLSDFKPLEPPVPFHKGPEIIRAGDKMVLGWHMPWKLAVISSPKGPSFPLTDWPKEWPGTETIEINGVFKYNDGFDDVTTKRFCFRWLPMFSYAIGGRSQGIGGMPTCDDTVSTIQWSLAQRNRK